MAGLKNQKEKKRPIIPNGISGVPRIEMLGNREIIVDGCKGIAEYGENVLKLNTGELVLSFAGDEMVIESFDNGVAVIKGRIAEITFVT